jgi:hypothetical protein
MFVWGDNESGGPGCLSGFGMMSFTSTKARAIPRPQPLAAAANERKINRIFGFLSSLS